MVSDLLDRAYEIKYHWREEPPPPEIVENLTAKGGDVRKRTLETFNVPGARETGILADGAESAEDEQKTPKVGGALEAEEPGSGGRYSTSKRIRFRHENPIVSSMSVPHQSICIIKTRAFCR